MDAYDVFKSREAAESAPVDSESSSSVSALLSRITALEDETSSVRTEIRLLTARLQTLEDASTLFPSRGVPATSSHSFVPSSSNLSGSATSINPSTSARSLSSGRYMDRDHRLASSTASGSANTTKPTVKKEFGSVPIRFTAAAALSAHYGKMTSLAQGKRPPPARSAASLRSASSTSASVSTSATGDPVPVKNQITFKNGITLIKDRRLVEESFMHGEMRKVFEHIVEDNYLRIKPVISKLATEREVFNIIVQEFGKLGHQLLLDGQTGYEFGYFTHYGHRLKTLGPMNQPRQLVTGAQLKSEYDRNDCVIIVRSNIPYRPYDPMLWDLARVIDDSEDEDDLPDLAPSGLPGPSTTNTKSKAKCPKGKDKGKNKAVASQDTPAEDFKACGFCNAPISVDYYDENMDTCSVGLVSASFMSVKSEIFSDDDDDNADDDQSEQQRSPNTRSRRATPVHSCSCKKPDDAEEEMVGCDGDECLVWRHRSCASPLGFKRDDWFCQSCRRDEESPSPGPLNDHEKTQSEPTSAPTASKKRKARPKSPVRSSSRLRQESAIYSSTAM
ncbi:hypothetical protein CF326_g7397 [Tilletia indica]|nr:hypothetical protein CF326_g7397 [Tilletia indica]